MESSLLIGKLSHQLGIPPHTIRYYERLGLLPALFRADNGYRVYSKEHEERLIFILKAKRFGFSLEEIKSLVTMPCEEVKKLTKMHLDELNSRIQKMIAFRDELQERYRQFESVGAASGAVCGLIEGEAS
ncbi:MAG: MerR family DNA-binding protein [Chloroflexi bacterium]|nr:MerR family DNA-binding protein [Chloroflexota bacterium]